MKNQDTNIMVQDPATIQLKWYQRVLINSNKKLVTTPAANRVISIDWCKGFAIFWIIVDHLTWVWLPDNILWYARFLYLWLGFLGPVTFLFFAGVNTTMSYRAARAKNIPHALIHYETFRRMMGLLVVVIISRMIDYFAAIGSLTPLTIFFQWDILQAIAFSAILTVPLLKFSPRTRLIIAAVILMASYPFYQYILRYQTESLVAQILNVVMYAPYLSFGPLPITGGMGCPLFPMIAFTIIGSIVIDLLLPIINGKKTEMTTTPGIITQKNHPKSKTPSNIFEILLLASFAIIVFSLLFGSGPNEDPFFQPEASLVLSQLHQNQIFQNWQYVPQFLIINHPMYFLFNVGVESCFFLLPFYYFEIITRKNYAPSWSTRTLSFFGQFSLSYYAYSFIFALMGITTDILGTWIGSLLTLIVLTLLFRFFIRKAYGGGLVEFVMVTFAINSSFPPSIKDVQAVYPEKVAQFTQGESGTF